MTTTDLAAPRLMKLDMLAPHQKYRTALGKEVPGCTTIVRVINKPQLIAWANELGKKGVDVGEFVDAAADLGKVIHARAEAYLRGYDGLDPQGIPDDLLIRSEIPFTRFVDRWAARGLKVVASECQLVSEALRVGGTLDILAEDPDGRLLLADLKSSNPYVKWSGKKRMTDLMGDAGYPAVKPYRDVLTQVGGYSVLWNENHPDRKVDRAEVWRIGKAEDDPGQVHRVADLQDCENAFRIATALHYALWKIE